MVQQLNEQMGKCSDLGPEAQLENVSLDDAKMLTACVTRGVRTSIFKTMTAAASKHRTVSFDPTLMSVAEILGGPKVEPLSLKKFKIRPKMPSTDDWERILPTKVTVYRNQLITSIDDLRKPSVFGRMYGGRATERRTMLVQHVRRAAHPFAQGGVRIAYHGQLAASERKLDAPESAVVLKSFKYMGPGVHAREQYLKQIEVSNIAAYLGAQYNRSTARPSHCTPITFLQAFVVEDTDVCETCHCAEALLPMPETFTKYSNNTGHWAPEVLDESLLRFSEWTYQVDSCVCSAAISSNTDFSILCYGRSARGISWSSTCRG
jgi:hypothetical protein